MKKIIIYLFIFNLFIVNFSFSAVSFDKYALIKAVRENSLIKTKKYLTTDYKVNLKDEYKNTALTYSIYNENYEISKLLLKGGANPQIKDNSGKLIYCSAKTSSDYKIRKLFENYDETNCDKEIFKKTKIAKSTNLENNSFWNWRTIGAGILGVSGIVALAGGGGGSSGGGDGANNKLSPADRNYNMVGEVNQGILTDILNNPRYNVALQVGTTSYSNLNSYSNIRVAYSLARGYTGKVKSINDLPSYINQSTTISTLPLNTKIKVAIIDTGVQINHKDLVGNITTNLTNTNIVFNFCRDNPTALSCVPTNIYIENNPNPEFSNKENSHGTFVAGIIGATYSNTIGVMGIAPESEIIPYRVTFDNGNYVANKYIGDAFNYAANAGATVINNSFGIPTLDKNGNHNIDVKDIKTQNDLINIFKDSDNGALKSNYINQMLDAVKNKDTIFVWAAGNDGTSQSGVNSAIPLFFEEFKNGEYYKNFINVVAYDSNIGSIAGYSNKCGLTKEFCLTAPGTNIISTASGNNTTENNLYSIASGTSFSAPIVSGAVAVIKGAFPYLTGAEITKLLFITARDLGELGVDDIYGWGMLDLERATRPVGVLLVPLDIDLIQNSSTKTLSSSNIKINSKLANNIMKENLTFVALDSFNRTFTLNLNDYITTEKNRINTIDILNKFGESNIISKPLTNDRSFNLYYNTDISTNKITQEVEFSYTINNINENNFGFNLYYGNNPYNAFIENKVDFYNNFSLSNLYEYNPLNPYFKNDSDINFAFNNIMKVNDKINVNFGILYQNYIMNYDQLYNNKKKDEDLGAAFSFLTGITYNVTNDITTKIETGILNEYETLFGNKWSGAFSLGGNNLTYIASLQNNINIFNNKISVFGKINFGYTKVNKASNSLIKETTDLFSNSFAIGLNYNLNSRYKIQKSNISLLLMQPIKINSGNFKIFLPTGRDNDGNIYYNNHKINFKNDNEINLQLAYNYLVTNDSSFNLGFIYKNYLDNEYIMLLKYKKSFNF